MSETDPGFSEQHAGYVGARRATVGEPTDRESMNVPQTRPGAAEHAHEAELAREGHETFIPETPVQDEREEAAGHSRTEEKSLRGSRGAKERRASARMSTQGEAVPARGDGHRTASGREASGRRSPPMTEEDLRREIEETRRELGATVGALMEKANVKNWAGHAAGRAKARARSRAGHAREAARERAGHAAEAARERAAAVKGRASHMADVAGRARAGMPEHVRDAAAGAGRRPALLLVMVAAGAVSAFALRQIMRDRSMARHRTSLGRTMVHLTMTGRMPPRRTRLSRILSKRNLPSRMPADRMLSRRTGLRRTGGGRTASGMPWPGGADLRRSVERRIEPYRAELRRQMATRSMPGRTLSERTGLSESVARRVMPSRTARGRSMPFRTRTRRPMARHRLVEAGRHGDRIRIVIRLP